MVMSQPPSTVPADALDGLEVHQPQSPGKPPSALPASMEPTLEVDDAANAEGVTVEQTPAGTIDAASAQAGPSAPTAESIPDEWLNLTFKWSGKTFELRLNTSDLIYDLRANIETLTSVPPAAQKILGLGRSQLRPDSDGNRISTINLKDGTKFTVVGTPEHLRFKEPEIQSPEEWDMSYPTRGLDGNMLPPALDPRNLRRVAHIIKKRPIEVMNPPRPGKRLLVLDLDYTIADTRPLLDGALPPMECARPGLHQFLSKMYEHYDIVVWSQTRWTWLETKLVELGVLGADAEYKICFVADRTTMFPIFSMRNGQMVKHEVKPLAYLWATFPQWSAKNSIHLDDLGRNFALNPGEGLRIRAFKGAGTEEGMRDRELERVGHYLLDIATSVDDYSRIDHSQWKKRVKQLTSNSAGATGAAGAPGPSDAMGGPDAGPDASGNGGADP